MAKSQTSLTKGGLGNLSIRVLSALNFLTEGVVKGTALPLEKKRLFFKELITTSLLGSESNGKQSVCFM